MSSTQAFINGMEVTGCGCRMRWKRARAADGSAVGVDQEDDDDDGGDGGEQENADSNEKCVPNKWRADVGSPLVYSCKVWYHFSHIKSIYKTADHSKSSDSKTFYHILSLLAPLTTLYSCYYFKLPPREQGSKGYKLDMSLLQVLGIVVEDSPDCCCCKDKDTLFFTVAAIGDIEL